MNVSLAVELMTLPWSVQVPGSIDGEVATPMAECLLPIAAVVAKYRTYRPLTSVIIHGRESVIVERRLEVMRTIDVGCPEGTGVRS